MEYIDVVNEKGQPTGETVSRDVAHRDGIRHRTAHVWIVRKESGRTQILLQKRSEDKDSFPGKYDTSSAGHIPAGCSPRESALRELKEELGIEAGPDQLAYAGTFHNKYEKEFHGRMFRDDEVTWIYVFQDPVRIEDMTIQKSELSEVRWFDLDEIWDEIRVDRERFCVPTPGLKVLRDYLMEEPIIRKQIVFYGWVQGVGFRYRAIQAARHYGATGWVRNDYDGTVTMEIQGTSKQIDDVILFIEQGTFIRIENMDIKPMSVKSDEYGFVPKY